MHPLFLEVDFLDKILKKMFAKLFILLFYPLTFALVELTRFWQCLDLFTFFTK